MNSRQLPDGAFVDPRARLIRYEIAPRSLFTIVAIGVGLWLLVRLWPVLLLIVVALILAGTLSPVVAWLERHRVRRPVALGLILLALVGAIVGLGALVIPALATQVAAVVESGPALRNQVADYLAGIPLLSERATALRSAEPSGLLTTLGERALAYATTAAQLIIYGLTTVVLAFYLLADHERVQGFCFSLLPRRYHLRTARVLLDMETIVGGYVRGQALTSVLIGSFTFVTLAILGVPNALALAAFAAFADLIPFVGAFLAVLPPVLAALQRGPVTALIVLVALVIYQQIESHLVIPRVYGQTLRLSPVAVLIALLIGGELLGVIGALLALPLAAGIRVLVEDLRIELPGEQPGEETQRVADERAEVLYAAQADGASAVEAAVLATALAERMQEQEAAATGQLETPSEERGDDGAFASRAGAVPGPRQNPARPTD
jgi:predicted PurR-regulated permease PerM